jgi:hypothetical protein
MPSMFDITPFKRSSRIEPQNSKRYQNAFLDCPGSTTALHENEDIMN